MEKSFAFNSINKDRVYKAEDFASYFASFIGNGIFPNPASQLQVVDNNDMSITVKEGKAWINGYYYQNTNDFILKLDPADSVLNRIDRVVLRLDFNKRAINLSIKKGEFSSNAVPKDLQRDSDAYEIALADIKISKGAISITQADITDLRLNNELCGIVHGTVEQVDTTAIFNQFQDWYSTTKNSYDKDITNWTKEKKEAFDNWYSKNTQQFSQDFQEWFESLKDKLDGDVAAKLQKQIDQNTKMINDLKNDIDTKEQSVQESIDNLKSHVDNGKSSLYSAIVGKKVTPRSKDFSDLVEGIKDIKLGQGNAQASQVLNGRTFTNDSGIKQTGTMPNMGTRELTPKTYVQELGKGYYDNIKIKDVSVDYAINNLFTSDENKKEIINQMTIPKVIEILKKLYDADTSQQNEIEDQLSKNFICNEAKLKCYNYEFNEKDFKNGIIQNTCPSYSEQERYEIPLHTNMYKIAKYIKIDGTITTETRSEKFHLQKHFIMHDLQDYFWLKANDSDDTEFYTTVVNHIHGTYSATISADKNILILDNSNKKEIGKTKYLQVKIYTYGF